MEIKIENLTKYYGIQKAVDSISFNLKSGEVLGFLGPNGAGKSTTMRIISCFMAPSSGDVLVNGKSIFENPEEFKSKIGYLPENNPLYLDMFVIDFLFYVAHLQQVPSDKIPQRVKQIIDYVGLNEEKHKKIGELSKGFRQRVGLAQALIHDPEVLILDEPTSGLDPNQIIEIRSLIKNLGREKTILLSTHIMQEVEATCDRIIIINRGKIVADSTPEMLQHQIHGDNLLTVQLEAHLPINEISNRLKNLPAVEDLQVMDEEQLQFQLRTSSNYDAKKQIFDLCVNEKWYLLQLKESEARLEDIFRQLTSNN